MKHRSALIIAAFIYFYLGISSSAWAGSVQVAQSVPYSFVQSQFAVTPIQVSKKINDTKIQIGDFAPVLQGLDLNVHAWVTDSDFTSEGANVKLKVAVDVQIKQMAFDQVIEKNISGNIIQIRVNALCEGFSIQIPNLTVNSGFLYRKNLNLWTPTLETLSLHLADQQYYVSPIRCSGINGFDQSISEQIQRNLENPAGLEKSLQPWLASVIDTKWSELWSTLMTSSSLQNPQMQKPTNQGIIILAELPLLHSDNFISIDKASLSTQMSSTAQLFFSRQGFEALTKDRITTMLGNGLNLQDIPSFHSFMRSRFLQFFLWSDLLHFSKSSPFLISAKPEKTILELSQTDTNNWTLQMQSIGLLQGERDHKMISYIDWSLGLSSSINPTVVDGVLKINLTNSKAKMNWKFDKDYVSIFHPRSHISESVLKKAMQSIVETKSVTESLGDLKFNGRTWQLQGWKSESNLIKLDWIEKLK